MNPLTIWRNDPIFRAAAVKALAELIGTDKAALIHTIPAAPGEPSPSPRPAEAERTARPAAGEAVA